MNNNEKKALLSFLSIYVGSTMLLLGIMMYSYYQKELEMLDKHCSIEMASTANMIRGDILKAQMDNLAYKPKKLKNAQLKYGIFDKDRKLIYSQLVNSDINFDDNAYYTETHAFHIAQIEEHKGLDVKYIVVETDQLLSDIDKLKYFMIILLLISTGFILLIGYLLAKLLLKPVREKIEHMDNFIKDSAHELNTPISVLLTSASTFKQGRNPEKMMKYMLSSTKQISQIYNDIHFSAFNEINENVNENVNLAQLTQESVDFLTDIANAKDIKIESSLDKLVVFMDRTKTQKLVNNLISNAIKYSNKNSKIIVTIKGSEFCVQDFGIGISLEEQSNIFKRYKRSQANNEGGFGIGLDIVSRINKEYKLKLSLESELKKGSTFCIDFKAIKQ